MKLIAVRFDLNSYLISVPDQIAENPSKYAKEFYKWLVDDPDDHGLWVGEGKKGLCYETDEFVGYLNKYHVKSKSEKVTIADKADEQEIPYKIPEIWF